MKWHAPLCGSHRIDSIVARAIYLTPHRQFPTTVTLSAARRLRLIDFAQRARIAIVEDDYDHEFHVPAGGIAIWTRGSDDVDIERWAREAAERGVIATTGGSFAFDRRPRPYFRLGFAALTPAELAEAVRRLALACRKAS